MRNFRFLSSASQRTFFESFRVSGKNLEIVSDEQEIDSLYCMPHRVDWPYEEDLFSRDFRCDKGISFFPNRYFSLPSNKPTPCRIDLCGNLVEQFNEIRSEHFAGRHVIGLHYRHGNGEFLDGRFDQNSFPDFEAVYQRTVEEYASITKRIMHSNGLDRCTVLVCSDNKKFREDILIRLPSAFTVTSDLPIGSQLDVDFARNEKLR